MYDRDSDSNFKNMYHNHALFQEYYGREEQGRDLGFIVDLLEFCILQAEGFIGYLHEVEHIFYYKNIQNRINVKLVAIELEGRAYTWWEQLKWSREWQGKAKIGD